MVDVFLDAVAERGALFTILTQARLADDSEFESQRKRCNRQVEEYMARLLQAETGVDDDTALVASSVFLMGALGLIIAWVERGLPRRRPYLCDDGHGCSRSAPRHRRGEVTLNDLHPPAGRG